MAEPKFGSLSGYDLLSDEEKIRKAQDEFQNLVEDNASEEEIYSRLQAKYPKRIIERIRKPQPLMPRPPTTPLPENAFFRQVEPPKKEVPSLSDYVPGLEDQTLAEQTDPLSYLGSENQIDLDLEAGESALQTARDQREKSIQDKTDKLKMAQIIAQNLDLVGRGMVGLGGNTDPRELPRVNLGGLEEEIANREDVMTPEERSLIQEGLGINVPEGVKFSRFEKMAGPISVMAQREISAANQAANQAARESRFVRGQQFQEEQKKEQRGLISDPQIQAITDFDSGLAILDAIESEKPQFDTGPLAGRWHGTAAFLGMADAEKAGFKQMVIQQFNDTLRRLSGVAISPGEVPRMSAQMPTMNDQDNVFMAKLQKVRADLTRKREIYLENLRRRGKNVSEYSTPAGARPTGPVTMVLPDGQEVPNIDASQIDRFQAKYPGSQPKR